MTSDRYCVVPAAYVLLTRPSAAGGIDAPDDDRRPGQGEEVLLQRRQHTGFMDGHWAAGAAGHIEAGESVQQAAVREAHEELGITIAPQDLQPLTAMHRTQATGEWMDERVDFFFACARWTGRPRLLEAKATDLRWVDLSQLDSLDGPLVPHERYVLDALRTGDLHPITSIGFPPTAAPSHSRP